MVNDFIGSYKKMWEQILDFGGRTSRREFWQAVVANFIVCLVVGIVFAILPLGGIVWKIISYIIMLAEITMVIRRLRDAGLSPYLALLWLIPVVGWLIVLLLCATPSK